MPAGDKLKVSIKNVLLSLMVILSVLAAGCLDDADGQVTPDAVDKSRASILVTDLDQINRALEKGPVLLKLGSESCPPCKQLDPIIDEIAEEYADNSTVMYIDTALNPELGGFFSVYSIPDCSVIVGIEDGYYVFMDYYGNMDTDRGKTRLVGLMPKEVYVQTLNNAIQVRQMMNITSENMTSANGTSQANDMQMNDI